MGFKIEIELTDEQIDSIVLARMGVKAPRTAAKPQTIKSGPSDTEIRQWAHENDVAVNEKGRVKKEVKLQFLAANDS